jgi:hypothetical protein
MQREKLPLSRQIAASDNAEAANIEPTSELAEK